MSFWDTLDGLQIIALSVWDPLTWQEWARDPHGVLIDGRFAGSLGAYMPVDRNTWFTNRKIMQEHNNG